MRTLATKQSSTQDSVSQKPVRVTPAPVRIIHSLSTVSTGSTVLQRKSSCACGGGCPHCQAQALLQTKLKISEPGDQYEQEADHIADQVMRMPEPSVQRQAESEEEDEEEMVQRKAITPSLPVQAPAIVHEALHSPGEPLDSDTHTFMESRFGRDFSQVRIHTDEKATESARSVNALAYTVGQNIVFGENQYTPQTQAGRKVLAHELTHTIQQSGSLDNGVSQAPISIQRKRGVGGCAPEGETEGIDDKLTTTGRIAHAQIGGNAEFGQNSTLRLKAAS